MTKSQLTRRSMIGGLVAAGGLLFTGAFAAGASAAPARRALTAAEKKLTMHRSPGCGCCLQWVEAAKKAGFTVAVVDDPNIYELKKKLGVPESLLSCHTTLAGAYVVEGHVPLDAIKKLLVERPKVKGIGVPGMPMGSPGMEHGDHREHFEVFAFDAAGKVRFFD